MSEANLKPLNWTPDPNVGFQAARRPDGGMHVTFTDVSVKTLESWREFALEHLLDSDRLTRNLYDLRQIEVLPEAAIRYAIEVNTDPSVRNLRLAVLVSNAEVRQAVQQIAALTPVGGVELGVFEDIDEAEAWLDRPLTLLI